jgi:hypothetical protein
MVDKRAVRSYLLKWTKRRVRDGPVSNAPGRGVPHQRPEVLALERSLDLPRTPDGRRGLEPLAPRGQASPLPSPPASPLARSPDGAVLCPSLETPARSGGSAPPRVRSVLSAPVDDRIGRYQQILDAAENVAERMSPDELADRIAELERVGALLSRRRRRRTHAGEPDVRR